MRRPTQATINKAKRIFLPHEMNLIAQGKMLSYNGRWCDPRSDDCITVELVKYGYYFTGRSSVDGRFIVEPTGGPKGYKLYDSNGDKTILTSIPRYPHNTRFVKSSKAEFDSFDIAVKYLYHSYWVLFLEQNNLLHLVNLELDI